MRATARAASRVLVVVPSYGHHDLTHRVLGDLARERDRVDVVVVDNLGDYPAAGDETVIRPGTNLGWAGGTNLGTEAGRRGDHGACLWLNNDTRLSPHFVAGLVRAWEDTGAGVIGPVYDCHWTHQRARRLVEADRYRSRRRHHRAPFVDGTAMLVPATTLDRIGLLDDDTFAPFGSGAEVDYCLRARRHGLEVVVSEAAYLHHERSATASTVLEGGYRSYLEQAYPTQEAGLVRKWGPDWAARNGIDPVTGQSRPLGRDARLGSPRLGRAGRRR